MYMYVTPNAKDKFIAFEILIVSHNMVRQNTAFLLPC